MTSFFDEPGWNHGVFNGHKYRYYAHKAASPSNPTFLLIHGFPAGPMTYQAMVPHLKDAGHGINIPELIGYSESDKDTSSLAKFARKSMADDLAAIMDKEEVKKAIVVGHDIGVPLAAGFVRFHTDRSIGLVLASVSYSPPSPTGTNIDKILEIYVPILGYANYGYWKTFLAPHGPKLIEDHLDSFISIMYAKDPYEWRHRFCEIGALEKTLLEGYRTERAEWVTPRVEAEMRAYLVQTGMEGPLAWYHASVSPTLNLEAKMHAEKRIKVPYLFIGTGKDQTCPPILGSKQSQWCDDLTTKLFDEEHWVFEADAKGAFGAIQEWGKEKGLVKTE